MARKRFEAGNTILTVLVTSAIAAGVALMLSRSLTSGFRATASMSLSEDILQTRRQLATQVDCAKTLNGINVAGIVCTGNATPLVLLDRNGVPITGPLLTSGVGAGAGKLGAFHLRTTCDGPNNTLQVLAARPLGDRFLEDPASKRIYNWTDSRKEIFSAATGLKICTGELTPTSTPTPVPPAPPGTTLTPKGKCEVQTVLITPASPLAADGLHRGAMIVCSNNRPVLMSLTISPACQAVDYACTLAADPYPHAGGCLQVLLGDNTSMTAAQRQAAQNNCTALGQDSSTGRAQGVCCDF